MCVCFGFFFFFSSRRRHTRSLCDWSSDVCSSDLLALQAELPVARIASYLKSFGGGEGLDFVHLCCLARAWTAIAGRSSTDSCGADFRERILRRIEQFRSKDGGYSPVTGAKCGTAYGCFLALAGLQVSFEQVKEKCLDFIDTLWTNEGAFHGHWGDEHLDCEYTFYGLLALGHLSF